MAKKNPAPNAEQTQARIAETAYYKSEQRGFIPGFELEDWLAAEHEVNSTLAVTPRAGRKSAGSKSKVLDLITTVGSRKKKTS